MKCKICGREMTRARKESGVDVWICRNPKCPQGAKKEAEKSDGDQ